MVVGYNGMTMGRLKFRENITAVKNMVNGLSGTIMGKQKSKEPLILVR